jgi:Xaa-Pro dipeptidase
MSEAIDLMFPAHIAHVRRLADTALEREGCDGVVVYSGRPSMHFLDDHGPPFKASPHFLHWAPVLEAPDCFIRYLPGRRPQLLFHQPADYWHKPPEVPAGPWAREFDIHVIREPGQAREPARYRDRSHRLHRRDARGICCVGASRT